MTFNLTNNEAFVCGAFVVVIILALIFMRTAHNHSQGYNSSSNIIELHQKQMQIMSSESSATLSDNIKKQDTTANERINIWQAALHAHYANNRHHPEYFQYMEHAQHVPSELDYYEMLCDLLSSARGAKLKHGAYDWTIEELAYVCRDWPAWQYVRHIYEHELKRTYVVRKSTEPNRWHFDAPVRSQLDAERDTLIALMRLFVMAPNGTFDPLWVRDLHNLECVQHYLIDLAHHRESIVWCAHELFPNNASLVSRAMIHDHDKLEPMMIAAYTLKWIFNVEQI